MLRMILDQMDNGMDTAMNRSIVVIFIAKILTQRFFLIFCNVKCMTHKLVHALILRRRNRNYRHSEQCLHSVHINRSLIACHLIHHIQCNNHRNIHLQKLHRQIKISLNIRRINNIDQCPRLLIQHKIP